MTTEGHKGESRGSERGHSKKEKKYAKANCIRQQLTQEEYEREKVEIAVHLELLMELLWENEKDQRHGLLMRKRVKWQRLQQKRDLEISMQLTEEKIIDDFLSYWANPDQMDNAKPCIFVADNCGVITGFAEEDVQPCATVTVQEEALVDAEEVDQSVAWISEVTVEFVKLGDFQTGSLCVNAGDDDMLQQCYREIALLEYWLENPEYDREIAEERVQYSEQEEKDIMETDGMRGRLVDSLESSLENSLGRENQHTDVLIGMEQHTEILAEGSKALMPCDFCFNMCFVNAGIVAGAEKHLTPLNSQIKGKEVLCSRRQEGVDDPVAVRTETNIETRENLLDKEIEMMRRMMMKEFRKRPAAVKQKRSRKRKTAKDCKNTASGAKQHKVWRLGEEQQTEAAANGKLQYTIWDPGKHRSEHMIRRS